MLKLCRQILTKPICRYRLNHNYTNLPNKRVKLDKELRPIWNLYTMKIEIQDIISAPFPKAISVKPLQTIKEIPSFPKVIECPKNTLINEIMDIIGNKEIIQNPNPLQNNEIQAARLIVIRHRKMKKHKLKKLRKRMKFEWAKVRQRREMKKEKLFQAELLAQIKNAEKFSAETYVSEKIRQANEVPIPRYWKGRRLPQFIIKQKLGIK